MARNVTNCMFLMSFFSLNLKGINSRSLSEPRHQATLANQRASVSHLPPPPPPQSQLYTQLSSNFATEHQHRATNDSYSSQQMNRHHHQQHHNSSVETYDNLSDHQLTHQSRIDSSARHTSPSQPQQQQQQQPQAHFDRYTNSSLRPHYNSMRVPNHAALMAVSERDIKSVDREILYNYYKQNSAKQQPQQPTLPPPPGPAHFVRNTPKRQSLQVYNIRDIKSCERDLLGALSSSSSSSSSHQNTPVNGKSGQHMGHMMSPSLQQAPVILADATQRSRSGSVTPRQDNQHQQLHRVWQLYLVFFKKGR